MRARFAIIILSFSLIWWNSDEGIWRQRDATLWNYSFIKDASDHPEKTEKTKNCPYDCDPVKALGGPQLSRPKIAFSALMILLAAMYFSDKGLERRPFGAQHICCWLLATVSGTIFALALMPFILRIVWPFI